MGDSENKLTSRFERFDELGLRIREGMSFTLKSKVKLIENEKEGQIVHIEGVKIKKGDKFELKDDLKLKKKKTGESFGIEIDGANKFNFEEEDIIIVTGIDKDSNLPVNFKVDRNKKVMKNKQDEDIIFSSTIERFIELFDSYADLHIDYAKFRLKEGDIVRVIGSEIIPYTKPLEGGAKERNVIVLTVEREGRPVYDTLGDPIKLEINASIFVQRFDQVTSIEDVVGEVKDTTSETL